MIGDAKNLQYWEYKKGELQKTFTSDFESIHDISRVIISGTQEKASVFLATGSQIRGFTKKGKDFFKLDTSHTDSIVHLHVQQQELWSTGKHTLNCYMSTASKIFDKYFYLAEDIINHMMVATIHGDTASAIIAVQDKIRTIDS